MSKNNLKLIKRKIVKLIKRLKIIKKADYKRKIKN